MQKLYSEQKYDLRATGADVAISVCDGDQFGFNESSGTSHPRPLCQSPYRSEQPQVFPMGGKPGRIPMEDWRWVLDINVIGVAHGVEVFTPILRETRVKGGHFLNTASMAGLMGQAGVAPYVASKFAVVGYSESLRDEVATDNIGVSVLCPGYVNTVFIARCLTGLH